MNQLMLNNAPQKIVEMKIGPSVHTPTFDFDTSSHMLGRLVPPRAQMPFKSCSPAPAVAWAAASV